MCGYSFTSAASGADLISTTAAVTSGLLSRAVTSTTAWLPMALISWSRSCVLGPSTGSSTCHRVTCSSLLTLPGRSGSSCWRAACSGAASRPAIAIHRTGCGAAAGAPPSGTSTSIGAHGPCCPAPAPAPASGPVTSFLLTSSEMEGAGASPLVPPAAASPPPAARLLPCALLSSAELSPLVRASFSCPRSTSRGSWRDSRAAAVSGASSSSLARSSHSSGRGGLRVSDTLASPAARWRSSSSGSVAVAA
mmetsp:Transcript_29072/g.64192  ORF Transcript_29072/g.64192 Transcript_29072/m.64192 type:complete len:250 (+) Transcript_29072:451-1200(+)